MTTLEERIEKLDENLAKEINDFLTNMDHPFEMTALAESFACATGGILSAQQEVFKKNGRAVTIKNTDTDKDILKKVNRPEGLSENKER